MEAGLNRVEADELTYGLHILIRTELEIDLIEGGLPAEDIPEEWNKRYGELLGIKPTNDSEGCLQDVHWSEGAFGYFPSYLLGHLISAQISVQMERDIGLIDDLIQNGEYQKIIFWLRNNVHKYGRSVNSMELIRTVTKEELSPNYFINHLEAGLNRVEADELTYGLHILVRTELEIDLIEGGLPAEDIPDEWNKRYGELLGIKPSNDSEGCLQDVHWSEGAFGYFPSYLLGHLISAQISSQMERDIGLIDDLIQNGEYQKIIIWLRNNIHKYGRSVNSMELIRTVTKEELSPNYFINHLKSKINDFC